MSGVPQVGRWRRMVAYWWYLWGSSLCYWGLRSHQADLFRGGVGAYTRAISAWPEFTGAYLRRATIRSRELGEHPQAIVDLTRAIEMSPDIPELFLQRGLIQRFHGDPYAALSDLEHFINHAPTSDWRAEAERQVAMLREDLAQG